MEYYLLVHRDQKKGPRRAPTFWSWLRWCITGKKPVPRYSGWNGLWWDVWWFYGESVAHELREPDEIVVHATWMD